MKGYQALADALAREGVQHVFVVAGSDNLRLLLELKDKNRARIISARKEGGAAAMADGYARATRTVGVCIVTVGPGLTNAGTALTAAKKYGSPLLCITTEGSIFNPGNPKWGLDQRQFAETTAGKYMTVRHAETLAEDIMMAFRYIRTCNGPLVFSVPKEIMEGELEGEWEYLAPSTRMPSPHRIHPDPEVVAAAAGVISAAERPIILAGRGAWESGADDEIRELSKRTGAVLATTVLAKGYLSDHPCNVGIAGPFASEAVHSILSEADCVVAVGCSLNVHTTEHGLLFAGARIIHIERSVDKIGETTPVSLGIVGDARVTLAALNNELERRHIRNRACWKKGAGLPIAESRSKNSAPYVEAPDSIDPRQLVAEMDRIMPEGCIVVVDSGHFSFFTISGISAANPDCFQYTTAGFGCVGVALHVGIGAAVGRPDQHVVVFTGDGGFMMTLEELDTAVRYRIPITVVVMNDNGLGSEVHLLETWGQPTDIVRYDNPDFAPVATALGAVGLTVRNVRDLQFVSENMGKGNRPLLVDAKVNPGVVHDVWQELHPSVRRG